MHLNQAWDYRHWNWISEELEEAGLELTLENTPRIIDIMDFRVRGKKHPERCSCYKNKRPCHAKVNNLNCLICACHQYDLNIDEGGCLAKSKLGKWFYGSKTSTGRTWNCEDCPVYHTPNAVKNYLEKNIEVIRRKIAEAREAVKTEEYKREIAKLSPI